MAHSSGGVPAYNSGPFEEATCPHPSPHAKRYPYTALGMGVGSIGGCRSLLRLVSYLCISEGRMADTSFPDAAAAATSQGVFTPFISDFSAMAKSSRRQVSVATPVWAADL